ncbi:AAA ATPase-like protein [Kribbella antiqua]|uniref:AAA ATPase-like protein n=1 Tax=Kribbella antiqua TaxID=2512217 RepID=A0A4R2INH4_9ACTN|nr:ATP-binding protein [Kribbella antiqua]TCO46112.1 AAA ATPase-like protein [Kribbella antiqua]
MTATVRTLESMSLVFGTPRRPAYTIPRKDRLGRSISYDDLPDGSATLFTGPPGIGKSLELDRAEAVAEERGWTAIRVEASEDDSLENRLTRAINDDLKKLHSRYGRLGELRQTVRGLTRRPRNTQFGAEIRALGAPLPVQFIAKHQWDATAHDNIGTTLNDFADQLAALARRGPRQGLLRRRTGRQKADPILLMVDNVDAGSKHDLAGLNELAAHLRRRGLPVHLIAAGGAKAVTLLMAAGEPEKDPNEDEEEAESDQEPGIGTTVTNQFDIRELAPLTDDELRPALTEPLNHARIPYHHDAIDELLRAANGDPSRLRDLAEGTLALTDPRTGFTVDVARAAIERVSARAADLYQGAWTNCDDAQKDLLAKVAAQGPNGLWMPAETQPSGPGHWQVIDRARQNLVARGILREDGERVHLADAGLQNWVNAHLGQTPAAAQGAPSTSSARAVGQSAGPSQPALDQAKVDQVLDRLRSPTDPVRRTDKDGRPISLDLRIPDGTSVLFTGAPGMGTSLELDRAQALADKQGWTAIRVDASPREPLEYRFVRAITQDLDTFRERYGHAAARTTKRLVGDLARRTRSAQSGAEGRAGIPGMFQMVGKVQWDSSSQDTVGSTLLELADHLGKVAAKKGEPIMLMVDNLESASDHDLKALTQLSKRLEENRTPLFLIGAGGERVISRMMKASGGRSGAETTVMERFDRRKVEPLADDQLRQVLAEPLRDAEIPYDQEAVDILAKAANGSPRRLGDLAANALELADAQAGLTVDVAKAAMAQLNERSRVLYQAAWNRCTDAEMELLRKAALRGSRGLSTQSVAAADGPGRWDLDNAAQNLISRGLLRKSEHRIEVADPGLQDWLQTRLGHSAAHAGVALPTAPTAAMSQRIISQATVTGYDKGLTNDDNNRKFNLNR